LNVTVLQRMTERWSNDQIEAVVRCHVARLFSTRMSNTLRLRVEVRSEAILTDCRGTAKWTKIQDHSRKEYTIRVRKNLDGPEMDLTIAHELVHVLQYAEGRLRHGGLAGESGWFWKPTREGAAQFYPYGLPWADRPWEQEACRISKEVSA